MEVLAILENEINGKSKLEELVAAFQFFVGKTIP